MLYTEHSRRGVLAKELALSPQREERLRFDANQFTGISFESYPDDDDASESRFRIMRRGVSIGFIRLSASDMRIEDELGVVFESLDRLLVDVQGKFT